MNDIPIQVYIVEQLLNEIAETIEFTFTMTNSYSDWAEYGFFIKIRIMPVWSYIYIWIYPESFNIAYHLNQNRKKNGLRTYTSIAFADPNMFSIVYDIIKQQKQEAEKHDDKIPLSDR